MVYYDSRLETISEQLHKAYSEGYRACLSQQGAFAALFFFSGLVVGLCLGWWA